MIRLTVEETNLLSIYNEGGKRGLMENINVALPFKMCIRDRDMARELVKTYPFLSDDKAQMFKPEREALGSCPRCGLLSMRERKTTIAATRNVSLPCGKMTVSLKNEK